MMEVSSVNNYGELNMTNKFKQKNKKKNLHDELLADAKKLEKVEQTAASVEQDAIIMEDISNYANSAFLWMHEKAVNAGNAVVAAFTEIAQDVSENINQESTEVEEEATAVESYAHQAANLLKKLADYIDDEPNTPTGETRLTLTNN